LNLNCKKDEGPIAPVDPGPVFTLSSVSVTLQGGVPGIQFFAKPDMDVILIKVEITPPPPGEKFTFNAGSTTYIKEQTIMLQDVGIGYVKISGRWAFKFVGNRATGTKASFDVTYYLDVGA
jgi:hypothetical protein